MILRHVIIKTRLLNERLAAHRTNFPPITRVDPLVQVQGGLPKKRLPTKPAMVVLHSLVLKLVLVHTFEAKGLILAEVTLIPLTHHVEIVNVLAQLNFCVEHAFARVTFESVVDVMRCQLMHR